MGLPFLERAKEELLTPLARYAQVSPMQDLSSEAGVGTAIALAATQNKTASRATEKDFMALV